MVRFLWHQDGLKNRGLTAPAIAGNSIVIGDKYSFLHWLSMTTGKLQSRVRLGSKGIASPPVVADNNIDFLTKDGFLAAFRIN